MSTARLQRLAGAIDAMSLRERAMVGLIIVLLLWAAWQTLLMAPLSAERKSLMQRIETTRTTVAALNQSIQTLAAQRARDPLAEQRLRLEQLQKKQRALDDTLAQATSSLVDPQQMGAVLEAVLAQQKSLTLVALGSLPTEPLNAEQAADLPSLFRHGMHIEVEGDYLALLQFVSALDALPWEFIWNDLELTVNDQQRSRMRLTLHTLSLKPGWLGV